MQRGAGRLLQAAQDIGQRRTRAKAHAGPCQERREVPGRRRAGASQASGKRYVARQHQCRVQALHRIVFGAFCGQRDGSGGDGAGSIAPFETDFGQRGQQQQGARAAGFDTTGEGALDVAGKCSQRRHGAGVADPDTLGARQRQYAVRSQRLHVQPGGAARDVAAGAGLHMVRRGLHGKRRPHGRTRARGRQIARDGDHAAPRALGRLEGREKIVHGRAPGCVALPDWRACSSIGRARRISLMRKM
jgi:hypothetical protein